MNWPDNPIGGRLGDGRFATATDRPETIDALRQVVIDRVAHGHAIYPQGGCTALEYGEPPRLPGVAIDTTALRRVIEYPAADMTITVEAGITLAALREVLVAQGQRLNLEAPQPEKATLGGIFATNTCGPRRFGLGRPRDQVIGVGFVTSDGEFVKGGGRVVKNVAGYDFPRLLTGSLGTLGIISVLTLKVRPVPEASAIVWVSYPGPDNLASVLERLNTSATRPVAVEVLNPSAARYVGGSIGLPAQDWALAVGFEDNTDSVSWQVDRLMMELGRTDIVIRENADAIPLWNALTEFQAAELGSLSVTASVRPSAVVEVMGSFEQERWAVQSHAGNGIIRAHRLGAVDQEEARREVGFVREKAGARGGFVTLPRCPTEWKSALSVWGPPRPDWVLSERIKQALDPRGVMNPGRFVGSI